MSMKDLARLRYPSSVQLKGEPGAMGDCCGDGSQKLRLLAAFGYTALGALRAGDG